jgi:hypothetical protein
MFMATAPRHCPSSTEAADGHAAVGPPAEDDAPVLGLEHLLATLFRQDLDGVLVAEVIGRLGGLVGVLLPRTAVLADAGAVDAALCGVGVRADGVDLRDHGDVGAHLLSADCGAHAGEAGADHEYVVLEEGHQRPRSGRRGAGWGLRRRSRRVSGGPAAPDREAA